MFFLERTQDKKEQQDDIRVEMKSTALVYTNEKTLDIFNSGKKHSRRI